MVPFKPHSAVVYPAVEAGATQTWASSTDTVPCLITPMSATAAYEKFGVELSRPWQMLCETAYSGNINFGDKITEATIGKTFIVKAPCEGWLGINPCNHCHFVLEIYGSA